MIAKSIVRLDVREDGSLSLPVARTRSSGFFPITPAFSADSRTLYVANEQSKSISAFRVGADGLLSELASSPYATGRIPHNPALSRDGRYIYFANTFSHTITGYEIESDGALTPLSGSPFATPTGPATVSISTNGRWLYLVSSPFRGRSKPVVVSSWRIHPDGNLQMTEHPPIQTGWSSPMAPARSCFPRTCDGARLSCSSSAADEWRGQR